MEPAFLISRRLVLLILLASLPSAAQLSPWSQWGTIQATAFDQWSLTSLTSVPVPGVYTLSLRDSGPIVISGGPVIQPLATDAPLLVGSGTSQETATPSAVQCSEPGGCTITIALQKAHPVPFSLRSGTYGLQEAINYAATQGDIVELDPSWKGTSALISAAAGAPNVRVHDDADDSEAWYVWSGARYTPQVQIGPGATSLATVNAQSVNGKLNAAQFPGSDIGAQINAAETDCPDVPGSGCVIQVPANPNGYRFSTGIVLNRYDVSLQCARGTYLYYTGSGEALLIGEGAEGPYLNGQVSGCWFDGLLDTNENVDGVRMVNTNGFSFGDGFAVQHFEQPGDAGMVWQNQPVSYNDGGLCPHCADGSQNERNYVWQVTVQFNATNLELESKAGAGNSFEYNRIYGLHLQQGSGQVGLLISGNGAAHSATLLHSLVAINSNTTDPSGPPATLIEVVNGGEAYQDRWDIFSEETTGSQQIPYDVGTGALLDFSGTGQTVVLAGGGPPVDNGTFYPPQTINGGAVNAVPGAGSLSLGGINWAGLPGAADLGLAGNSATGGRYNSSIPMGGWAAGLGFVMGPDIQHPYAWCSNLDPICFEVDRIDTSKQLTRVFSVSGNGDTSLHAATASSLEIGGDAALSAAPRLLYSAFIPGLSEPVTVATWIPDKAIMVTRIEAQAQIPPSACATNAVVELADGAESQLLTVTQSGNDSGPVSFAGPAGTQLVLSVATAAAGCATVPSAVNVIVQYRMQ